MEKHEVLKLVSSDPLIRVTMRGSRSSTKDTTPLRGPSFNQEHSSPQGTFLQPKTKLPSGDFPSLHNSLILWTPVVAPQKIRIIMVPLLPSWSSGHPYCFSQELPTSFKIVLIKCLLLN